MQPGQHERHFTCDPGQTVVPVIPSNTNLSVAVKVFCSSRQHLQSVDFKKTADS